VQKDYPKTHWGRHNAKMDLKKMRDLDIKNPDQIVKKRMFAEMKKSKEKAARIKNTERKKRNLAKMKRKMKSKGK
jgi:ATP-dependent RNA helicase DDX54/DBP10